MPHPLLPDDVGDLAVPELPHCLHRFLGHHAQNFADAPAIVAPRRHPLSYSHLYHHIFNIVKSLTTFGVGRNDRVAIVLPAGPELAVTYLAVAAGATGAPLNPTYRPDEFDFYLSDLQAKALILQAGLDSPVRAVAQAKNLPIIELEPSAEVAGLFTLSHAGLPLEAREQPVFAEPDDVALVLHTSGTTARPKIVPLTQTNICGVAANISRAFALGPSDRCLNVMPLFHAHGLLISTLASLLAGGSVVYPAGFEAESFFHWLQEFDPTWYTASPTIHQAVIDYGTAQPDVVAGHRLRFIRSSSAPLPPSRLQKLERLFNVPVIEGYGMTECVQITSNPLPPQPRKIGSVGLAAGPEVAIIDEAGRPLPPGQAGEVVIRDKQVVMPGYENSPAANRQAFHDDWFRTGDQGYFDEDGYLYLTGRLKELINRGGEKIAPREVDETLKKHPAVVEAVTFAVPHPTLGEDIAAAVILHERNGVTEPALRRFVAEHLAPYKVPNRIISVDQLPQGPTGKLQRLGLAQQLAEHLNPDFVAPRTALEQTMAELWGQVLGIDRIGVNDNFFSLGGNSLTATQVLTRLRQRLQADLALSAFFEVPTIAGLVELIQVHQGRPAFTPPLNRNQGVEVSLDKPGRIEPATSGVKTGEVNVSTPPDQMEFSLFFFSADGSGLGRHKYQLFLDSVKAADRHGFSAVWIPERHFHPFGGLYPNPSILGAAIATMTGQIQIRAGSVVLPFQDPLRVAEEWSVVDNLSGGRIGLACASGWHANDFVLAPDNYAKRKEVMFERLEMVQKLWRGESITRPNGAGKPTQIQIYPRPIQPELPLWLASHSDETFVKAGKLGLNILTTIWNTTVEEVARQIKLYRQTLVEHGYGPQHGRVTLMLHTFIDDSMDRVRQKVKSAYEEYLYVNLGLQEDQARGLDKTMELTQTDKAAIVSRATDQLFKTRGLIGTPEMCRAKTRALQAIGVDEIACLIDFGIDLEATMASLDHLNRLKDAYNTREFSKDNRNEHY